MQSIITKVKRSLYVTIVPTPFIMSGAGTSPPSVPRVSILYCQGTKKTPYFYEALMILCSQGALSYLFLCAQGALFTKSLYVSISKMSIYYSSQFNHRDTDHVCGSQFYLSYQKKDNHTDYENFCLCSASNLSNKSLGNPKISKMLFPFIRILAYGLSAYNKSPIKFVKI